MLTHCCYLSGDDVQAVRGAMLLPYSSNFLVLVDNQTVMSLVASTPGLDAAGPMSCNVAVSRVLAGEVGPAVDDVERALEGMSQPLLRLPLGRSELNAVTPKALAETLAERLRDLWTGVGALWDGVESVTSECVRGRAVEKRA